MARVYPHASFGQNAIETRLLNEILAAAATVAEQPALSGWKTSHPQDRIDLAHYEAYKDDYQTDLTFRWCATSVAKVPAGLTKASSFYVPEVSVGKLPSLPQKLDPTLTGTCRLGSVWFEVPGIGTVAGVIPSLTKVWGKPDEPTHRERFDGLFLRGSALWRDVFRWRRGTVSVWVAWQPRYQENDPTPRLLVWISLNRPRDLNLFEAGFDTTAAALKMAGLDTALNATVALETQCAKVGSPATLETLSGLLAESKRLPPERHAAALLVADSFAGCVQARGAKPAALAALGVKTGVNCAQDGAVYLGNFREQAEAMDTHGPAGALAALASLQSPCSLRGNGPWPDLAIAKGRQMLDGIPKGDWTPWVHFALARAHAAKLLFSMPPGEVGTGVIQPLTAAASRCEREEAIREYTEFIGSRPDTPEAVFAWQQAWRLSAALPPAEIHFGCGCE